jgi:Na+-translocating ferredoxin:NAD+ oxidoreductase RnfD subunit
MGATAEVSPRLEGGVSVPKKGAIAARFTLNSLGRDPRLIQILFLGSLLAGGAWLRDFPIHPAQIILTFATALVCQVISGRAAGQKPISYRSVFITAFGISLLLRADSLWAHPLAAAAAIISKFVFRWRGKHLFNPANFGVVLALTFLPGTWVSPGQWGQDVAVAGWLVALGATVTHRARRGDVSWSFLASYMGALGLRVAWLGQNWSVWAHQFSNGALLLFAFFMISDPMTIPNSWSGRVVHAAIVATIAYFWGFDCYRTNGFLWALFIAAPAVPLWDWLWPAPKFQWVTQGGITMSEKLSGRVSRVAAAAILIAAGIVLTRAPAVAFCGFYVGKADSGLYNHASQVVYVRHEDKNVLSIMNDYQGEPSEFALVVPVPVVLQKGQVHIGERELFTRLDAYSSPRLVEYYDPDPCERMMLDRNATMALGAVAAPAAKEREEKSLGVRIEAQYTVGEYDIVILSATQSGGLETWLQLNGYKVPLGASRALQPYIRQNMKFFVARVNLKEHQRSGLSYLRPLQFAFDSPRFMLPIRLGMVNAQGPQDLVVYVLTEGGRVETTNYRAEKVPTGMDLPEYIRNDFGDFYKAMFARQAGDNGMRTVFTEYVWDMGWCDPCAAPPLSHDELRQIGVFWLDDDGPQPDGYRPRTMPMPFGQQLPVILTRLHVRYSAATFPEDLMFQETQDKENFQARYVLRHAWAGAADTCPAAKDYFTDLHRRREAEASALAELTGWNINDIYRQAGFDPAGMSKPTAWWEHLWH